MIRQSILAVAIALGLQASSQTLFTYGNDSVSVQDFLQAYEKNNSAGKNPKAMQEYLDLYITARLKIKEAKARGYDTLPNIVSEMQNLRAQILPNYLNDPKSMNKLVNEAFDRSQKDIHLMHIFIPVTGGDTASTYQKAMQAYQQLQKGVPFATIAKQYSGDPSAASNSGDLGFITVFSLPYELENLAYATPPGKISPIYRSKAGYHIFKNAGERKALGRMRAAQVLLAFPPGADAASKQETKKLADSLYNRLLKGDDFGKLAAQFSADPISAQTEGRFPEFGVGQYDPVFEATAFALSKDSAISKPFATAHGYHIIKRMDRLPVNKDRNNVEAMQQLREKVQQDERINTTQADLVKTVLQKAGYKISPYQQNELKAYTSQALDSQTSGTQFQIKATTPLFQLGNKTTTVDDWITYARNNRFKIDGTSKPFEQLWDEFMQYTALEYYKDNLETFNPEFRSQLTEFREGNLFFEIMQKEVWGPAQNDTVALQNYYLQHKDQYIWKKSADAIVFYAGDATTAQQVLAQLKKSPGKWREIVEQYNEKVTADSARFEWSSIPGITNASTNKTFTQPQINKSDNTTAFAYIIQVNMQPVQRTFAEARGSVINDYGIELEKKWVEELKKKYPVKKYAQAQLTPGP
ncbi:peptidylprolyl isomerase [Chitinophagaceae bacterium LB-8]|uniref:Peptidylprolyl isomerase n=1 Tax=Paraflavisolibacter caeni TaxID=2982496 RepID=A0A9X2XSU7_9BACT|nr:peptidylprolyl isomerase [Paraflavisolibacter caeni]MCU7548509.1 peptidylprolyl isomerase [Paraflavisolibacter caeni]